MKRNGHPCAACDRPARQAYPFCSFCWLRVPKELRDAVRVELAKEEPDEAVLRDAVARAAASVEGLHEPEAQEMTEAIFNWNLAYLKAGSPSLEERKR